MKNLRPMRLLLPPLVVGPPLLLALHPVGVLQGKFLAMIFPKRFGNYETRPRANNPNF
jgi:ABC-type molybdate transport system permease subunit